MLPRCWRLCSTPGGQHRQALFNEQCHHSSELTDSQSGNPCKTEESLLGFCKTSGQAAPGSTSLAARLSAVQAVGIHAVPAAPAQHFQSYIVQPLRAHLMTSTSRSQWCLRQSSLTSSMNSGGAPLPSILSTCTSEDRC